MGGFVDGGGMRVGAAVNREALFKRRKMVQITDWAFPLSEYEIDRLSSAVWNFH